MNKRLTTRVFLELKSRRGTILYHQVLKEHFRPFFVYKMTDNLYWTNSSHSLLYKFYIVMYLFYIILSELALNSHSIAYSKVVFLIQINATFIFVFFLFLRFKSIVIIVVTFL